MVVVQVTRRRSSRHGESWDVFPHPNAPSRVLPLVVKRGRTTTDEIRLSLCNTKITIAQIYSNKNAKRRGSVKPHFKRMGPSLKIDILPLGGNHAPLEIFDLVHLWKAQYFFLKRSKLVLDRMACIRFMKNGSRDLITIAPTPMGCIKVIEQVSTALFHIKNLSQTVT